MKTYLVYFWGIPRLWEHDDLVLLCEAFGEINNLKRPMDSEGVYLDFMFLVYKEERAVYYLVKYLIGLEIGGYTIVSDANRPQDDVNVSFVKGSLGEIKKLTGEDKEISYKLKTAIGEIEWHSKIKRCLVPFESNKSLGMHKINKIKALQESILGKLDKNCNKTDFTLLKRLFYTYG